jgi:hypothetical protein
MEPYLQAAVTLTYSLRLFNPAALLLVQHGSALRSLLVEVASFCCGASQ